MTAISRRSLLKLSGSLVGFTCLPLGAALTKRSKPSDTKTVFFSALTSKDQHYVTGLDVYGSALFKHVVPSRGHSGVMSRDNKNLVFVARRPGTWIEVIDGITGERIRRIEAAEGRHFYGHGIFNHAGDVLYVSENDYENTRGVIGIYDAVNGFSRIGELPSFGIGPHDLGLLSDGTTLAVANGGIATHPDYGRLKLNLESMAPSLTYIDVVRAKLIDQVLPPHHQLSLRHLCVTSNDSVAVGAQYQGAISDNQPLLFVHTSGGALEAASQPAVERQALNGYIASVVCSADGRFVATSSPRGDVFSIWDMKSRRWLGNITSPDVGGLSFRNSSSTLWLSSGTGGFYVFDLESRTMQRLSQEEGGYWDNHLGSTVF